MFCFIEDSPQSSKHAQDSSSTSDADSGINCTDSSISTQKSPDVPSNSDSTDSSVKTESESNTPVISDSSTSDVAKQQETSSHSIMSESDSSLQVSSRSVDRSENVAEIDSSVIVKSPEREETHVKTSTPQAGERERHDSRMSIEDAEFEEDRIMGRLTPRGIILLLLFKNAFFRYWFTLFVLNFLTIFALSILA